MGPRKTVLTAAAVLFAATALPALAAPGRPAFVPLSEKKKLDHLKRQGVNAAHVVPARGDGSAQAVDLQIITPASVRIYPTGQVATFTAAGGPGAVIVSFNTTKGMRYLVDCGVTIKGSLKVTASYHEVWSSNALQAPADGHILVAFTAAPSTASSLDGGAVHLSSNEDWTFTGCEVDEVQ
jgi:hypothetical protein